MGAWSSLVRLLVSRPFSKDELTLLVSELGSVTDLGSFPLHFAALRRDPRFAMFLIQQGAQVNAFNLFGETALHWAVKADREEVIASLLGSGASAHFADAEGKTPLDWAMEEGNFHLLPILRRDMRMLSSPC